MPEFTEYYFTCMLEKLTGEHGYIKKKIISVAHGNYYAKQDVIPVILNKNK